MRETAQQQISEIKLVDGVRSGHYPGPDGDGRSVIS
jgi:hypothetical protein